MNNCVTAGGIKLLKKKKKKRIIITNVLSTPVRWKLVWIFSMYSLAHFDSSLYYFPFRTVQKTWTNSTWTTRSELLQFTHGYCFSEEPQWYAWATLHFQGTIKSTTCTSQVSQTFCMLIFLEPTIWQFFFFFYIRGRNDKGYCVWILRLQLDGENLSQQGLKSNYLATHMRKFILI